MLKLLFLLQITFIDTTPKPPKPCSGPAMMFCAPADAGKPTVTLTTSSGAPLTATALTINASAANYSLYAATGDDSAVVRAELWRKGESAPLVTLTPVDGKLGKNLRFLVNMAFYPKGTSEWFVRVRDGFGNVSDSKSVAVTRK